MQRLVPTLFLCCMFAGCSTSCPEASKGDSVFKTVGWLRPRMLAADVMLLDARGSYAGHLRGAVHSPWQSYAQGSYAEASGGLLKPVAELQEQLRLQGVAVDKPVLIYGTWQAGWGEEGRIHWMLSFLGHRSVYILRGGLQAYSSLYPGDLSEEAPVVAPAAPWGGTVLQNVRATQASIISQAPFLIDVREQGEYDGSSEQLYGVSRRGHVRTAVSFPFQELFSGKCLLDCPAFENKLSALGWIQGMEVAAYCTGGIRSGFFWSVLQSCGFSSSKAANYDGSMWEWASNASLPMSDGRTALASSMRSHGLIAGVFVFFMLAL